ncbi:hypothetical protein BO70DRAFT_346198 [Aspergillus heteromorphus CBS 117.55]|uniref:Uncharacterized protein n=1 Tax=Aspergillus heteromorphus CBS 117.55 TaxID=1448321 RepID=A0A317UUI7_9EURO|nr:uncharacterized protein BO70DRAFT_346198 [Aspergillus heteromorphus CBS 117.55]PWY65693.1 hypothetical protein BO70DRAFT_346198 [Aspergillus heteromorphus CBS 117.55]
MMSQATLEGLPVELHICVLFSIPDLVSVRSLILASPIYHEAYRLVRHELLKEHLRRYYDGLIEIQDAIAAVRSRGLYANTASNKPKIIALLDAWRRSDEIRRLRLSPHGILPEQPSDVNETIKLLQLHKMANFILDDYSKTANCPEWMDGDRWKNEILPLSLSITEKRRFFRAFYRLQIYGNIFGAIERAVDSEWSLEDNSWHDGDNKNKAFSPEEAWRLLFSTMAPWEVEEFGCFWKHCFNRYNQPYSEVCENLQQFGVMFFSDIPEDQRPPDISHYDDVDDVAMNESECRETLVSKGPALLCKVLREAQPLARRDLILVNASGHRTHFYDYWPRPNFEPGALPLLYPADKFNFKTDRDGFKKLLETLPPWERPNLAWERRWFRDDNQYREVFLDMFNYAPENKHWEWGYAFWDDERAIEWKAPMLDDIYPGYDH